MKRIFRLVLLIVLCMPIIAKADAISIVCPSKISSGIEFSCQINGYTTRGVASLSAKVKLPSGLSFVSFKNGDNWLGDGEGGYITLYGEDPEDGNFSIGLLKLKHISGDNNTITLESVSFYDKYGAKIPVDSVTTLVALKKINNYGVNDPTNTPVENKNENNDNPPPVENNNPTPPEEPNNNTSNDDNSGDNNDNNVTYTSNIRIQNYDLNFNENIYEYELTIKNEKKLEIITDNSNNIIYNIEGNEDLKDGSVIRITVTKPDSTTQEYRIKINKKNNKDTYLIITLVAIIVSLVIINIVRIIKKEKV